MLNELRNSIAVIVNKIMKLYRYYCDFRWHRLVL